VAQKDRALRRRKSPYFMINVTLSHDLDEFLQRVGNECRRQGGYHAPKTMILRSMIRVLKQLVDSGKLDLSKVFSEEEMVKRVLKACGLDQ
jgi:hypothetical protein